MKRPYKINIHPSDGILLTLPKAFFEDRKMNVDQFKKVFEKAMGKEDTVWNFKLTNLPKYEVQWVYLVFGGKIQYRCNLVMYERNATKEFRDSHDRHKRFFENENWVIFTGPVVTPSRDYPQRGMQGFRYTAKIF